MNRLLPLKFLGFLSLLFPNLALAETVSQVINLPAKVATGYYDQLNFGFGVRKDYLPLGGYVEFHHRMSPALRIHDAHAKVYLNDQLVQVIEFKATEQDSLGSARIPLDATFLKDYNQIRFEFLTDQGRKCPLPDPGMFWLEILAKSFVRLDHEILNFENDLAILPAPFVDPHDTMPVNLPFVFATARDEANMQAATMLASWFGHKGSWQGLNIKAHDQDIPPGSFVLFVTKSNNANEATFADAVIGTNYDFSLPTLKMQTHPQNPNAKVLVVSAPSSDLLINAVLGIISGHAYLSGSQASFDKVENLAPRKPYDSPNWLNPARPTKFGELAPWMTTGFSSNGRSPINVSWRVPPDLYLAEQSIPVKLNYKYSRPITRDGSRLNVSLNHNFLRTIPLLPGNSPLHTIQEFGRNIVGLSDEKRVIDLSEFYVKPQNQLNLDFFFDSYRGKNCQDGAYVDRKGVIDLDSTIDISHLKHFAAMPNLGAWSESGYPFTRRADLGETTVVIPENANLPLVSSILSYMAKVGSLAGHPSNRVRVAVSDPLKYGGDRDFLVFGWNALEGTPLAATQATVATNPLFSRVSKLLETSSSKPGVVASFASPVANDRTIVVVDGQENPEAHMSRIMAASQSITWGSDLVISKYESMVSERNGPEYWVGQLPWYLRIKHTLDQHIAVTLGTLLTLGFLVFILGRKSWRRNRRQRLNVEVNA